MDDDVIIIEGPDPDHANLDRPGPDYHGNGQDGDVGDAEPSWPVLIVDDDPTVHSVTRFALEDILFEGRRLAFTSAFSGAEAKAILRERPDIAVVLLDVVMETERAGLEVAEFIRRELGNRLVRIILRTGQPGQAPEREVIVNYDINDYKAKNELTAQKLFTAILASLRAYNQIVALEMGRQGLEKILAASTTLYEQRSVAQFVDGVVLQIRSLIQDAAGALLCAVSGRQFNGDLDDVRVVAGVAPFAFRPNMPIRATLPEGVCREIADVLTREESFFADDRCAIFFKTVNHAASVVYLCGHRPLTVLDRRLLEVFCSKLAIGFDNAYLFEQIAYEKSHDSVTGLLNRATFAATVDGLLESLPADAEAAICVLDCDRFRDVNEGLGYDIGDRYLAAVAERVRRQLDPDDLAARLGADQFVVLKHGARAALEPWTRRLIAAIAEPLPLDGCETIPSVAVGITLIAGAGPDERRRAEDHVANAFRAMRAAKRLGGGRWEIAAPRPPAGGVPRLRLTTELIHAIEREEFTLHYQPIVDTADGRLRGFEALIRWNHPTRGLLPPGAFIGLAEETGLILPVGSWVLERAARQLADWNRALPEADALHMNVNLSARQFMGQDLTGEVARRIAASGADPRRIKLEVTESLIMNDPDHAGRALRALKDIGVQLALDDFGTGYSSLSYLDRFPFDVLKIDRSFVMGMLRRPQTMAVVRTICTLADSLDLGLVGEGVETAAEASALAALGCERSQGYLFGKPMSASEAGGLVDRLRVDGVRAPSAV